MTPKSKTKKSDKPNTGEKIAELSPRKKFLRLHYPLFAVMLLGFIIRWDVILWQPLIYPDSMQYMHLAREIRSGVFFGDDFNLDQGFIKSRRLPPLYSFMLAPFAATQADLESVGIVISLIFSVLTFVPLYFGTYLAFGRRSAVIASLIFCFHWMALKYSSPILTEPIFTAFFAGVIAISIAALRKPQLVFFVIAGIIGALAYLTRDVGIVTVAVVAAGAVIKFLAIDRMPWRLPAVWVAALIASFLVVSAPYFAHIRARTGHFGLTVQMSNTSITEQVQLFGGTRLDRDRLSVEGKRSRLIGGKPVGGVIGLIGLAPGLVKKTIINMGAYGYEILRKQTPYLAALALAGLLLPFARREKDGCFMSAWAGVWVLSIWGLYSLITPYMVDARYMYPALIPMAMLAGRGISGLAEWVERRMREAGPVWPAVAVLCLLVVLIPAFPLWLDRESLDKLAMLYPKIDDAKFVFPLLGIIALMAVVALPVIGYWRGIKKPQFLLTAGLVSLAAGSGWLLAVGLGGQWLKLAPGIILLSFAAAALLGIIAGTMADSRRGLALSFFLVLGFLVFSVPNIIHIRDWLSPASLFSKYASGHKEVAADLKAQGLVPPGSIICSRKPFIPFYLDGRLYVDESGEPMPKTPEELSLMIKQHRADFLVLDSFTIKSLRPAFAEMSLGMNIVPGLQLIYSRYFPDYNRVITVYKCGADTPPDPVRNSASEYLLAADDFLRAGNLPLALRELNNAVRTDPDNLRAWIMTYQVGVVLLEVVQRRDLPTLVLAPKAMPLVMKSLKEWIRLAPSDPEPRRLYSEASRVYASERETIHRMNKSIRAAPADIN